MIFLDIFTSSIGKVFSLIYLHFRGLMFCFVFFVCFCFCICGQFVPDPRFEDVKNFIRSGAFGDYDYSELLGALEGNTGYGQGDYFLVGHDFPAYIDCQDEVDEAYKDQEVL